jgi:hypothetical protein
VGGSWILEWIWINTVGPVDPDFIQENQKKNISYLELGRPGFSPWRKLGTFSIYCQQKTGFRSGLNTFGINNTAFVE